MSRLDDLRSVKAALATGIAVSLAVGAAWVGLTAATGKTYHLASLLAALAPGVFLRTAAGRHGWPVALLAALLGVAIALAGWGVILAIDEEPTAVLFAGQPGGVFGEVLGGALIGGAIALAALRPRTSRAAARPP